MHQLQTGGDSPTALEPAPEPEPGASVQDAEAKVKVQTGAKAKPETKPAAPRTPQDIPPLYID